MKMQRLLPTVAVVLVATLVVVVGAKPCSSDEGNQRGECTNPATSPKCPTRENIIRCASEFLDHNNNGKLDRNELETAIDSLPWYSRGILQILGSVDKIIKKCDVDGDDAISMDYDMIHNKEQCLASCFKRRAFKNAFFPDCE